MKGIHFSFGDKSIKLISIVALLMLMIPFLNIGKFYSYPTKLILVGVVTIALLAMKVITGGAFYKLKPEAVVMVVFFGLLTTFLNFPNSLSGYIIFLCGVLFMALKYENSELNLSIKMIIAIGVFYALTMIWQYLLPSSFYSVLKHLVATEQYENAVYYLKGGDYTGFACESIRACFCIAPASCALFSRFFFKDTRRKGLVKNIILFCITYIGIYLSGRRAFILSFPAILIGIMIVLLLRNKKTVYKAIGIFILIVVIAVVYLGVYDIVLGILTNGTGGSIELSNRSKYWDIAISMFQKNPLFGNGLRSYDYEYNLFSGRNLSFAGAHNCYLQMLAEGGIVGTVIFFGFVLINLHRTLKNAISAIRYNYSEIGQYVLFSLLMQFVFVCVALSEAVFFAPYSALIYFIVLNFNENASWKLRIGNS